MTPEPFDNLGAPRLLLSCGEPPGQPRAKTMTQHFNAYRYYYYYGSLSARRDGAAMGCPGVLMI